MTRTAWTFRSMWPRFASWTIAAIGAGWLLLWASLGAAFAHASLASSDPAEGAVLDDAPAFVALTFSETVSPLVMRLVAPDGSTRDLSEVTYAGRTLRIEMPETLAGGTHVLSWRVVSEDGHPVGGSVVFSVGAPSTSVAGDPPAQTDRILQRLVWAAKLVLYAGIAFGIGGAFAVSWVGRPGGPGSDLAAGFAMAGILASGVSAGLQGLDSLARPLGDIATAEIWRAGLDTRFGATVLLLLPAFAAALIALTARNMVARPAAAAALGLAAVAVAASGHAASAPPQVLTRPTVALHTAAMTLWLGALPPLALGLRRGGDAATTMLVRFSVVIPAILALLLATGAVLACVQVRVPEALFTTAYGLVLVTKLGLVAVLLALAAINRWRLTDKVLRSDPAAIRALLRSAVAETLTAALILSAVALWRFTPPPRALAAVEPVWVHLHHPRAMADLTLTPGRVGTTVAAIALQGSDFGPLDAKAVTLVLVRPEDGIEPIRHEAIASGEGGWRIGDLVLPLAGRWQVRVDVLISDFEIARLEGEIEIRP